MRSPSYDLPPDWNAKLYGVTVQSIDFPESIGTPRVIRVDGPRPLTIIAGLRHATAEEKAAGLAGVTVDLRA